jgi:hypothetical protein
MLEDVSVELAGLSEKLSKVLKDAEKEKDDDKEDYDTL